MSLTECTQEVFDRDVGKHQLFILHDDGIYRHLRFANPATGDMHFEIVTYPEFLIYSGDMGCFVFERLRDMLQFFRNSKNHPDGINPRYWSEKLQAADTRTHGYRGFDPAVFDAYVREEFESSWDHMKPPDDAPASTIRDYQVQREACFTEIENEVLLFRCSDADEREAYERLTGFEFFMMNDLRLNHGAKWKFGAPEGGWNTYTFHFIWCLRAIVWGIALYDATKAAAPPQGESNENTP